MRPPTAFASATERRMSSLLAFQSRPMPRCAVSIASATPSPYFQMWRRNASVRSQSMTAGEAGLTSANESATTCTAAYGRRERGGAPPSA